MHPSLLSCRCINIFHIRVCSLIDLVYAILYMMKQESMQQGHGWVGGQIGSCISMESIHVHPSIHYCCSGANLCKWTRDEPNIHSNSSADVFMYSIPIAVQMYHCIQYQSGD